MKSKEASYRAHEIKEHLIQSQIVAQTFRIKVLRPISRADDTERFPVLYATDCDYFFGGCATLTNALQMSGETPRFILVGIGYEDAAAAGMLRWRDLVTHTIRAHYYDTIKLWAGSPLLGGVDDLKAITQTTDATAFLRFIRAELMPFVSASYPALPSDNGFFGYSLGGTFGLYTLFTEPDAFKRYIIGSPGTSYKGNHFGIELAKAFANSDRRMEANVFMSVGEHEEFGRARGQFDLVSGYYLLAKFLNELAIPGLDLTLRVFPCETHSTAWPLAFSHGVKTLFSPVDQVPFLPD